MLPVGLIGTLNCVKLEAKAELGMVSTVLPMDLGGIYELSFGFRVCPVLSTDFDDFESGYTITIGLEAQ